jgi:hypothetical protein
VADGQCVTVCRADTAPGQCIDITEPMPVFAPDTYVADARAFHRRQAELIHGALIAALPGGTLDHLFAVMAGDRASMLRVPRPVPSVDPDDVVDADVIGFAGQCATYERRVASAISVLEDDDLNMFRRHAIALEYLRSAL